MASKKEVKTQEEPKKASVQEIMATLPKGRKDHAKELEGATKVVLPPKTIEEATKEVTGAIPITLTNRRVFVVGDNGQPKHVWIQAPKEESDDVRIDLLKIKMGCKTQKDLGRAIIDLAYKSYGIVA